MSLLRGLREGSAGLLDSYQERSAAFVEPQIAGDISYFLLGLGGEAGEVLEKFRSNDEMVR